MVRTVEQFYAGERGVDGNGDGQLSLRELYTATERLTGKLARAKKPRPRTDQLPLLTTSGPGADVILFTK